MRSSKADKTHLRRPGIPGYRQHGRRGQSLAKRGKSCFRETAGKEFYVSIGLKPKLFCYHPRYEYRRAAKCVHGYCRTLEILHRFILRLGYKRYKGSRHVAADDPNWQIRDCGLNLKRHMIIEVSTD